MTIAEAIKALRKHEGLSQQAFGSKYGAAIASIQNWEGGKVPQVRQLIIFYEAAEKAGRMDLASVFQDHLEVEAKRRGLERVWTFISGPRTEFETLAADAFLRFLRRPGSRELATTVLNIIDISPLATPVPEETVGLGAAVLQEAHQKFRETGVREGFGHIGYDGQFRWGLPGSPGEAEPAPPKKKGTK